MNKTGFTVATNTLCRERNRHDGPLEHIGIITNGPRTVHRVEVTTNGAQSRNAVTGEIHSGFCKFMIALIAQRPTLAEIMYTH